MGTRFQFRMFVCYLMPFGITINRTIEQSGACQLVVKSKFTSPIYESLYAILVVRGPIFSEFPQSQPNVRIQSRLFQPLSAHLFLYLAHFKLSCNDLCLQYMTARPGRHLFEYHQRWRPSSPPLL